LKKGDRIQIENDGRSATEIMTILYSRKKWKKPFIFKINRRHYVSLKDRFVEVHESYRRESFSTAMGNNSWPPSSLSKNGSSHVQTVERSFHVIVVALLLRYSALSGGQLLGDLRGGGMQGAIHSSVFEVLRAQFCSDEAQQGAWLEGFASPFNATLPRFASVFPDLDWHFGSVGNFFDCSFAWNSYESHGGEFCEANPPFTPGVIEHMAEHIFGVLAKAEESRRALSFIVVVPSAGKREKISLMTNEDDEAAVKQAAFRSFKEMITNKYCTKHLQLKAREHGYIEGAQHLRPTMYKQSSYDTSIIILQSPEAMRKFSVDSRKMCDLDTDLRHAFSSRHENELKWRKSLS
jgi:phosphorylated CTD-interacting factor 1